MPLAIPKDLDLNMARMLHILLYKHACIPKVGLALPAGAPGQGSCLCCQGGAVQLDSSARGDLPTSPACCLKVFVYIFKVVAGVDSNSPAATCRLQQHWEANLHTRN